MLLLEFLCTKNSEEIIAPNSLLCTPILKPQEYITVAKYFYICSRVGLHVPTEFFCDDHDGMSFEAVFSFNVNNHGNRL